LSLLTGSNSFQFTLQKTLGVFQSNICLQTVPTDGNDFTNRRTITSWKRQISNTCANDICRLIMLTYLKGRTVTDNKLQQRF
ncbi:hypothetical protein Nmel_005212, partial [Mimus melanotis]